MDYKHLIESTTEYGADKLKPEDRAYIDGMRHIVDKDVLDDFLSIQELRIMMPAAFEGLFMDIAKEVIANLKEYLEHEIAEEQVHRIERYDEEPEDE